ncbi:MAG: hypothetical protein A2Z07_03290 [Armatimonadetes bacterium RBG_16_67_12]|nr:MAG: hypothetical protein A2Z07_03290 [Armatimonadetes bacterium RBG_16_67_12]
MSSQDYERFQEGPRVRIRPRVVRRDDLERPMANSLRSVMREAESRFLALQTTATQSDPAVVLSAYLNILADLGAVAERLHEASVRRDISFVADRRLTFLSDYCRWLARRVSAEFLLILQISLEQDLKDAISPEAYLKFLRLEEVEDAARDVEGLNDRDLMGKLRIGTLFRDILDQVSLDDVRARARAGASPLFPLGKETRLD